MLFLLFVLGQLAWSSPCGAECEEVSANGLTFDCRIKGSPEAKQLVLLLHGWPEWSRHWVTLQEFWLTQYDEGDDDNDSFRSVACDLRGYSPKASPEGVENYHYDIFALDTWAIADAVFGQNTSFHLVAHDHGAGLGWRVVTQPQAKQRIKSYTGISVPHLDAFSGVLHGELAEENSQVASGYFPHFSLDYSATEEMYRLLGGELGTGFSSPQALQKSMWWYNGSIPSYISRPPVLEDEVINQYEGVEFLKLVRSALPLPPDSGQGQTQAIGSVGVPTMFYCGVYDTALLCTQPYARDSSYFTSGYWYETAECGHNLFSETGCGGASEVTKVMTTITQFILANSL
eukprot:Lithocolla_globosa_v1_NODE_5822_length_1179_cov_10.943060.p1 type:complete len:345 gc:universal NODE_5822_length_1179_cov_10.943060:52-1086(+)